MNFPCIVNLSKEAKYQGVILDDELTQKALVRAQIKKVLRALWSCDAFIGGAWESSPKMTLWLYKRVIIPKITNAAVAWWDILNIASASSKLNICRGPHAL